MARRGGGYRAPRDYDPRRGKPGRAGGQRGGHGAADTRKSAHRDAPAADAADRGPALPPPPAARLQAVVTRPEDVAGTSFSGLGLGENIVRALAELGAREPFAIQAVTIPDALAGHHVLGRGRTGSGKTIAFGAALVERLLRLKAAGAFPAESPRAAPRRGERTAGVRRADRGEARGADPGGARAQPRRPKALILAPTRELALQIDRTVQPIARSVGLYTGQFVGGQPFEPQLHALQRGVDIAIGTPGRIEDLAKRGHLGLGQVAVTVIDEADHLAEMGFIEPVQRILRRTRRGGQRLLFSATLDGRVQGLVDEFMPRPAVHEVVAGEAPAGAGALAAGAAASEGGAPDLPEGVEHRVLIVLREHKDAALVQLVRQGFAENGSDAGHAPAGAAARAPRTIVFCRTRAYAEHVTELLREDGLRAVALHGDLGQARRERNLEKFIDGKADVLVATDVAARGIHVDDVELVLQADPPDDPKTYVHRAGRTGRVGGDGRLRPGTVLTVIPRTRQKRTRELFAALGFEPASFADYVPAGVS